MPNTCPTLTNLEIDNLRRIPGVQSVARSGVATQIATLSDGSHISREVPREDMFKANPITVTSPNGQTRIVTDGALTTPKEYSDLAAALRQEIFAKSATLTIGPNAKPVDVLNAALGAVPVPVTVCLGLKNEAGKPAELINGGGGGGGGGGGSGRGG